MPTLPFFDLSQCLLTHLGAIYRVKQDLHSFSMKIKQLGVTATLLLSGFSAPSKNLISIHSASLV
jgi:hypothetical protein